MTGSAGFERLLRAEWTKFRTVRGWVIGMGVAAVVMLAMSLLGVSGSSAGGGRGPVPVGPDGKPVNDAFTFVSRPLAQDGSITVRVTSLTGVILANGPDESPSHAEEPWAKAGVIIKASAAQGSPYAAIMVTPGHGVRMQDNFVNDNAGSSGAVSPVSPRWLRLSRSGEMITGSESVDGTSWTDVGTVRLASLPDTVLVGIFVTSPDHEVTTQGFGELDTIGGPTVATATFDHVEVEGQSGTGSWDHVVVNGGERGLAPGIEPVAEANGTFTVSGAGNIAPIVAGPGSETVEQGLIGAFAALIVVIVLGTMFITSEYRRGLIRTTLVASPRRGRVLAAKAIVLGAVTFVVGLAASAAAFALVGKIRSGRGIRVYPASSLTEVRIVVGTAALLAVAAVLAMAVGAVMRRGAGAVAAGIVLVVLPYILAVASVLPAGPARWLLRLTPAAAFSIQQSTTEYFQVTSTYTPSTGYFPLAPWAGFAVLCAWTAVALGAALVLLRRRDA